ncbi:MAG: Flp family type IVb pilin [Acidobacteria bacterium]|nr:Flp family type IVb pilin [Acidobacteriota bacterium]
MIKQFLKDESGQDIVEYSLLLVLIGAVAVLILTGMGTSINGIFTKIANSLNTANSAIPASGGGS